MSVRAAVLLFASVGVLLALGGSLLFRGGQSPITLARFLRAALAVSAVLAAEIALLSALGRSFLAIHVAFAALFYLLPALGLLLLVAARRRPVAGTVRAAAASSFALVPIWYYASSIEPYRLVVEHVAVPLAAERTPARPITIAVLSDIQASEVEEHHREAVARAMASRPDLVLLPGDLVQVPWQRFDALIPQFRELLAPLEAPLGVYFVLGNTDDPDQIRRLLEGTRVELLENRIVELELGEQRVVLGGVDLAHTTPAARETLRRLAAHPDPSDIVLLLAHLPDVAFAIPRPSRIDLVVAGHTHGGQVQLPFFGPPITLSGVPREVAAGGLHEIDGVAIYVSRGVGWEHVNAPRVRFLCPPEVSVLRLGAGPADSGAPSDTPRR